MGANENYDWITIKGKTYKKPAGSGETSENEAAPSAREEAETSIQDLRNRYSERIRENFDFVSEKLRRERDDALRENWILQQRAKAALPEQMAAEGINGGAFESTLANLEAQYQGSRNDIRKGYAEDLEELGAETSEKQAEGEEKYNRQWLEYLLSLAKKEAEKEIESR